MIENKLVAIASSVEDKIKNLQNVVGYGWGVKITKNRITSNDCVTIFVRRKAKKIALKEHIPPMVEVGEGKWPTDVVRLGRLRLEAHPQHIRCGSKLGVAGIYASRENQHFAVSCSHVVTGEDSILTRDDNVEYFNDEWHRLGPAVAAYEDRGLGTTFEWGAFDAGLARIDDPQFRMFVMSLPQGEIFDHQRDVDDLRGAILNRPVFAIRGNGTRIDAQVFAIMTNDTGRDLPRHDLLIRHPYGKGLTRNGDSGIVWRLANGMPLGMHFGGYNQNSQQVSTVSAAFFVKRVALRFGALLKDPVAA